jgi:plastocyanin
MIRARLLALAVLAAVAVAACSSASTASWTYAPASPATPAPSASAAASSSPASSAAASATASAGASAATSPGSSGGTTGTVVEIVAQGIAFTTPNVTAPAGQAFTLTFKNQDAGIPHNVHIKDSSGADVAKTDIVTGPTQTSIQVPALQPGTYPFVCDVHPNMTGTLTVK